jgi:hypothetical protein
LSNSNSSIIIACLVEKHAMRVKGCSESWVVQAIVRVNENLIALGRDYRGRASRR